MSNLLKSKFFLGVMIVTVMVVGFALITSTASADCSLGSTTLKYSSRGDAVACLQSKLGLDSSYPKGYFGNITKSLVLAFQSANNLTPDGLVGAMTKAALSAVVPTQSCLLTTPPWIKVLSPNGGETYTVGQQIPITWTTCNVPSNGNVFIKLVRTVLNTSGGPGTGTYGIVGGSEIIIAQSTPNIGSFAWNIPSTINSDNTYEIIISGNLGQDGTAFIDQSNTPFTINTPKSSFLYSNGGGIPDSFYIPWQTVEADFASPTNNGGYVCKSNGLNAQVTVLIDSPASPCPSPGMVGCGGSYKRSAIVCGSKYVIHDESLSGFPYWGYFDME